MKHDQQLLSKIPKIDVLLKDAEIADQLRILGRPVVVNICRQAVQKAKQQVLENRASPDLAQIKQGVAAECKRARSKVLGPVINGTGVLLHTNLGRAALGVELFDQLAGAVAGYNNLEIDVLERKRGVRAPHVSTLLSQLCQAEDAVVVNNNAASLFLVLNEFAAGKKVVVSRGELVQIGGGFRIPDILLKSGALLSEVGTTNITELRDYRDALDDDTACLLKVHRSNFHMSGFTGSVEVDQLAGLDRRGALLISDLGSGNLVRYIAGRAIGEATPADHLNDGADLVCFSCDKMLGSAQAGVIVGRAPLIRRIKKNPIMRALRADKLTYAALQIALTHYANGEPHKVQLWGMAAEDQDVLRQRVEQFISDHQLNPSRFSVVDSEATFGGGSVPGEKIPSVALCLNFKRSADTLATKLQHHEPTVIGTVKEGRFHIDFRTILTHQLPHLAAALQWLDGVGKK